LRLEDCLAYNLSSGSQRSKVMAHILGIFWRDQTARRLTYWHFQTRQESALKRAEKILSLLHQFTTLQIYGAILESQPLPVPFRPAPNSGWEERLEVSLFPASTLKPKEGINLLRFGLPAPTPELVSTVQASDWAAQRWQQIESEIFDYLCLPSGIRISVSPNRIKQAAIVRLDQSRRPEPNRSPLESIIIKTTADIERAQRSYQQLPTPHERQRLLKHQTRLAQWQHWQVLEQEFFEQALALDKTSSQFSLLTVPVNRLEEISQAMTPEQSLKSLSNQSKHITHECLFVPLLPPDNTDWADVPLSHFTDSNMWTHRSQILASRDMSERTYYRWIKRLQEQGLRSLPAQENARVILFYKPDLDRAVAAIKPTSTATLDIAAPSPLPATSNTSSVTSSNLPAQLVQTLTAIQLQQQNLATAITRLEANLAQQRHQDLSRIELQFTQLAQQQAQLSSQLPQASILELIGQLAALQQLPQALRKLASRLPAITAKSKAQTTPKKKPPKTKTKTLSKKKRGAGKKKVTAKKKAR
jgi:hypothetical protein